MEENREIHELRLREPEASSLPGPKRDLQGANTTSCLDDTPAVQTAFDAAMQSGCEIVNSGSIVLVPGEYRFLDDREARYASDRSRGPARNVVWERIIDEKRRGEKHPIVVFQPTFRFDRPTDTDDPQASPEESAMFLRAPGSLVKDNFTFTNLPLTDLFPMAWAIDTWFSALEYLDIFVNKPTENLKIVPLHSLLCQAFNDFAAVEGKIGTMMHFNQRASLPRAGWDKLEHSYLIYGYVKKSQAERTVYNQCNPLQRSIQSSAAMPWTHPETMVLPVLVLTPRIRKDGSHRDASKPYLFQCKVSPRTISTVLEKNGVYQTALLWMCTRKWVACATVWGLQQAADVFEFIEELVDDTLLLSWKMTTKPEEVWDSKHLKVFPTDASLDYNINDFFARLYRGLRSRPDEQFAAMISSSREIFDMLFSDVSEEQTASLL